MNLRKRGTRTHGSGRYERTDGKKRDPDDVETRFHVVTEGRKQENPKTNSGRQQDCRKAKSRNDRGV